MLRVILIDQGTKTKTVPSVQSIPLNVIHGGASIQFSTRSRQGVVPATRCAWIAPAFHEEESWQKSHWWFREKFVYAFVATTDQVLTNDLVMSALSDEVMSLFLVVETEGLDICCCDPCKN